LETEEQLKGYVNQTTVGELKQYIIAPLYLMLRDEIRKSKDISQTKLFKNLEYLKTFDDSFKYVVILLGAFFGFRKFYDNYYDALNLRFYKDFKAPQKQNEKAAQQEKVDTILKTYNSAKTVAEEERQEEKKQVVTNDLDVFNTNTERSIKAEEEVMNEELFPLHDFQGDSQEQAEDLLTIIKIVIEKELEGKKVVPLNDIKNSIHRHYGKKVGNQNPIKEVIAESDDYELTKHENKNAVKKKAQTELFEEK